MSDLKHLLSPITINNMRLANRCVMPPMGTRLGNEDGTVSEANLAYMKRQAQSGVGLIITEITAVHPSGAVGNFNCTMAEGKPLIHSGKASPLVLPGSQAWFTAQLPKK
jgi:2,4-dienoyl-CoA reductase-like NADH-dependent reductase (Old Yellow Enzyme family)